jgi:hypothetical protein
MGSNETTSPQILSILLCNYHWHHCFSFPWPLHALNDYPNLHSVFFYLVLPSIPQTQAPYWRWSDSPKTYSVASMALLSPRLRGKLLDKAYTTLHDLTCKLLRLHLHLPFLLFLSVSQPCWFTFSSFFVLSVLIITVLLRILPLPHPPLFHLLLVNYNLLFLNINL